MPVNRTIMPKSNEHYQCIEHWHAGMYVLDSKSPDLHARGIRFKDFDLTDILSFLLNIVL